MRWFKALVSFNFRTEFLQLFFVMEFFAFSSKNEKKTAPRTKATNFILNDCLFIKHEWNVWECDGRALSHCVRHMAGNSELCSEFYDSRISLGDSILSFMRLSLELAFGNKLWNPRKLFPFWRKTFFGHFGSEFSIESSNSPCETAGLEQLRERGILELPGASDESSQCLLFILLVVVVLPQFDVDDALLLSVKEKRKIKWDVSLTSSKIEGFARWFTSFSRDSWNGMVNGFRGAVGEGTKKKSHKDKLLEEFQKLK